MSFFNNKGVKIFLRTTLILVLFFILQLVACPVFGQAVQKKTLLEQDYDLMGNLVFHNATSDGKWCSFSATYKKRLDTLFLQNIKDKTRYSFPSASMPKFINSSCFIFLNADGLHVFNLNNSHHDVYQGVNRYSISQDSNQIAALVKTQNSGESSLIIIDKTGKIISSVKNVTEYIWSPANSKILFIEKDKELSSLGIVVPGRAKSIEWAIRKNPLSFKSLTWEKKGRAISFFCHNSKTPDEIQLCYYALSTKKIYFLDQENSKLFPKNKNIDFSGTYSLSISNDLNRVFFGISPKEKKDQIQNSFSGSNVEIWNGNDKWIYPFEKIRGQFHKRPNLAVWFPSKGIVKQISSPELPEVMITADQQFAILSNPKQYEPQFDYDAPRDFIIQNIITGESDVFLKKLEINSEQTLPSLSPSALYISYMKGDNCWIYDLRSKTHTNISEKINLQIDKNKKSTPKEFYFPPAGWTPDDKEIVLYDQFDLWAISADGNKVRRLTKGSERGIHFRLAESSFRSGMSKSYDGWIDRIFEPEKEIVLQARGSDNKTGFYIWKDGKQESVIEYKDAFIDKLYPGGEDGFFYQEQKFDLPPRLIFKRGNTSNILYQSNARYKNFHWGRNEIINFSGTNDEKLQALLYYPAQYDSAKKYPMILNVYENKTKNIYKYHNPSLENSTGFNPALLTSLGYFVLCPDILPVRENEGSTAFNIVVAAVNEIKSQGLIYSDKIGIIGHSFGGYETNFIVTHTNIFAAAVAGSSITNVAGFYYTVNGESGIPAMNYFKSGQLKADFPPSQVPEIFDRNSPITNVGNMNTPLLSFAGKEDYHVDWRQSVEFYMALRRIGKKNILLLYPNEGHTLINPVNQSDLTKRICEWFAYYLKDENPAEWIVKGML
jgi:hypothetical protein